MPGNVLTWPPFAQICEANSAMNALHLRWHRNATKTICMRPVTNGTMIPLDQWGAPDRIWCKVCARRADRPQPLIAQRQEEAAMPEPS